jgi:predicted nucleic acid-binding protein
MNWSRCFRIFPPTLLALLLVASFVTPVAAISASAANLPQQQQVGAEGQATFTLTDLYEDGADEFTLRGSTELENVSWTVRKVTLNGDTSSETFTGQSFETTVSASNNVERVEVVVTGRAPPIESFTYDPAQRFEFARLTKAVGDNVNTVGTWAVEHYTSESRSARAAIDSAQTAVAASEDQQAEEQLERSIRAYESGDFELAADLAADAEASAEQARQSSETTQLVLFGALGLVALALVGGAVLYVRGRSGPDDPLG